MYFTKEELKILNDNYSTVYRLRRILLNIFNADKEHLELFYKVLMVNVEYINSDQIFKDIDEWTK